MVASLPTAPGPRRVNLRLAANSASHVSPITGATQTSARFGAMWMLDIELPPLSRRQAGEWLSVLAGANGVSGSIYAGPHCPRPVDYYDATANPKHPQSASLSLDFIAGEYAARWVTTPTPLVDGGSQTGTTLDTDGWSEGDGLNKGDWIAFENGTFRELHMVTADSFADSNGDMTITLAPKIRRSPSDNAALIIERATGEFIAADNDQAAEDFDGVNGTRSIGLKLREFLR